MSTTVNFEFTGEPESAQSSIDELGLALLAAFGDEGIEASLKQSSTNLGLIIDVRKHEFSGKLWLKVARPLHRLCQEHFQIGLWRYPEEIVGSSGSGPSQYVTVHGDISINDLFSIAAYKQSEELTYQLLNRAADLELRAPVQNFPACILVMREALGRDKHFELWEQGNGRTWLTRLTETSNPFDAADECLIEHQRQPTVYRCISGVLVPFRATSGGVFMGSH